MKRIVVLGGYGGMGSVCVRDLVKTSSDCEIVVAGRDERKAKAFAKSIGKRVSWTKADASDVNGMARAFKGADVVVNCAQYYLNLNVMKACLKSKSNYLDLGGLYHTTLKQLKLDKQFKKIKRLAILGCGSSPGITNVMAEYGGRTLDRIDAAHFYFADKDWSKYDQPFVIPYSPDTLLDEFNLKAAVLENGKAKLVPAMSSPKELEFPAPVGRVKGYRILHSEVATIPRLYKNKGIKECDFRECFPDDFVDKINFLIRTGLASEKPLEPRGVKPRDVVVRVLSQWLPKPKTKIDDIEFLVAELDGYKGGKRTKVKVICKAHSLGSVPAGTLDTGVPPSIMAQMIANGEIRKTGAMEPGFCVDPEKFFEELKKRGMHVYMETEERVD